MARTDLHVPYAEKDAAKALGARWDPASKVWYIPDGLDSIPFTRWLPQEVEIQIRSQRYCIAEAVTSCWKCGQSTRVYGFVIPSGHDVSEDAQADPPEKAVAGAEGYRADSTVPRWINSNESVAIQFVRYIPPAVVRRIQRLSPNYRVDYSRQAEESYWMNHCEHCGMKQGDFNLFCEPGGAFFPVTEEECSLITLHWVEEPFAASYGMSAASMGHLDLSDLAARRGFVGP